MIPSFLFLWPNLSISPIFWMLEEVGHEEHIGTVSECQDEEHSCPIIPFLFISIPFTHLEII